MLKNRAQGKIGITKDNHNKLIYPEELQYYVGLGWQLGQKCKNIDARVKKFKETINNKTDLEKQQTKEKLRKAFLGKIWVTNGTVSKQIDPNLLDEFLQKGFVRGRKIK